MRLLFDWEYGVLDRTDCWTEALSEKTLFGYGEVAAREGADFCAFNEVRSVFDDAAAAEVEVEARPWERVEGAFFIGWADGAVGVGERKRRSAAGVGGGEIKATFL
jgi:hypothetical protein